MSQKMTKPHIKMTKDDHERLARLASFAADRVPDAAPAYDTVIEEGMIFTIEPMLTLGGIEWDMWDDDWTVVTRDRKRSAQFEHTMVVTDDGVDVLTLP